MATYKGINGFAVQSVASDPSPLDEGQVWYNNTSYAFKLATFGSASWASGGNMPTAIQSGAGFGTQTAAVSAGGAQTDVNYAVTSVFNYNGTSWSPSGGIPSAKQNLAGFGTQTAGAVVGGLLPTNINPVFVWYSNTDKYNGSSWTASGAYPTAIQNLGTAGVQTAALAWGGTDTAPGGPGAKNTSNTFNGSTWTGAPTLPVTYANWLGTGFGTNTDAVGVFSEAPTNTAVYYNGSSWATISALNNARPSGGRAFGVVSTAGVFAGGNNPFPKATETFNGTTWTNSTAMSTEMGGGGSAGTLASGLIFSGNANAAPTYGTVATEEWTGPAVTIKTITTS
jgi:hypothetical protein